MHLISTSLVKRPHTLTLKPPCSSSLKLFIQATMGEGGFLELTNFTAYPWRLTNQTSYQMTAWNFPLALGPGEAVSVRIEFALPGIDGHGPINIADNAAEATYEIQDGSGATFKIQARSHSDVNREFTLQVHYLTLSADPFYPKGSVQNLGWVHEGRVRWHPASPPVGHYGKLFPA